MPGTWTPETRRGFRIEPDRWGMVTPSATVPLAQLLPAPQDEPCRPGSVGQAFGGCFPKSLREQRRGVRVGFAEAAPDLESRGADEPLDHVGGRGAGASFDTGDRRLRHAGPAAQFRLCPSGTLARLADEIPEDHLPLLDYAECNGGEARRRSSFDVASWTKCSQTSMHVE